ncbi:hypothetical protein [Bacillus sp. NSP9.1]|uniref:hypothetical protein n=1 Tax=Bacillus sp. NSP9.1 TaxID=1071078 RepID=UPI0003FE2B5C|nr:hypothetical protein [Bacillus sp. NSP9.1]QHZ46979.1 hypothetical protein M654_012060 [Bacillus sp. NSP9.1]
MNNDIQFLKELQEELKTQDTDSQAAPRFWALMDYRWRETTEGEHERISIYSSDAGECYELNEYVENILEDEYTIYTYTKKVHTYAMTAWRAPKVQRLLSILETFDWDSFEKEGAVK